MGKAKEAEKGNGKRNEKGKGKINAKDAEKDTETEEPEESLLFRILTCSDIMGISKPLSEGEITMAEAQVQLLGLLQSKDLATQAIKNLGVELLAAINAKLPERSAKKVYSDEGKASKSQMITSRG